MKAETAAHEPVLAVDLDGTLIRSDLLVESLLLVLRVAPLSLLALPLWLLRGRAQLKQELADRVAPDAASLPYDADVLDAVREARSAGRRCVLVTGSHERWAQAVAAHLGVFDDVIATRQDLNMTGHNKARTLIERYGERGYDYVGDSLADLPAWAGAAAGWTVGASPTLARLAGARTQIQRSLPGARASLRDWLKAARLHQWLKNLLVFVPLLAAHRIGDAAAWMQALTMFFAFSLCASSGYLFNDLLDLPADRAHARKRARPFASGAISAKRGLIAVPLLVAAGVALVAWRLSPLSLALILAYYLGTLWYSTTLKRQVVVDVLTLASLYTLRIIAGSAATHIAPSFWLLAFSMFLFLSLAVVKRYSEVLVVRGRGEAELRGRGYTAADEVVLSSMGVASGYLAVLVLALYVNSGPTRKLYAQPEAIWLLCPLMLFWISRIWVKTHRGEMHDDPLVFAATDRVSWIVAGLSGLVLWIAA